MSNEYVLPEDRVKVQKWCWKCQRQNTAINRVHMCIHLKTTYYSLTHLFAFHVKSWSSFIKEKNFRIPYERSCNSYTLLLTATQLRSFITNVCFIFLPQNIIFILSTTTIYLHRIKQDWYITTSLWTAYIKSKQVQLKCLKNFTNSVEPASSFTFGIRQTHKFIAFFWSRHSVAYFGPCSICNCAGCRAWNRPQTTSSNIFMSWASYSALPPSVTHSLYRFSLHVPDCLNG